MKGGNARDGGRAGRNALLAPASAWLMRCDVLHNGSERRSTRVQDKGPAGAPLLQAVRRWLACLPAAWAFP
ncbi:hypothetical protein XEUV354_13920 [Xanthomonas euvesicatoria]|nr:hypothetical protein BHE83_12815 [Xanthomonas euvesicatoria pv. vesicatoria str. 85-10]KHL63972.1 hypothetical protein XEU66b_00335 [Xanthomonas euvesicatoria]TKA15616.1 hypothetical protein TN51_13915 [Xanthomonas euvesicatoria pv. citrumelonis]KHL66427.1 hypothetical protein XEU83M_06725 [Xanthomonas euvesicatoria]KLA57798.1 hypothetical protein XEUV685_08975 [Xanthomonas euvesicatoria]